MTIPFSGLGRTFTGGCYDPIVRAPTLHAPCMADRHCEHMPHTRCSQSALDTLKVPYLNDVYEIITFTNTQPLFLLSAFLVPPPPTVSADVI